MIIQQSDSYPMQPVLGLSGLGIACADLPAVSSMFQGPFDCEGSQADVPRFDASGVPATQGAIDAIWDYLTGEGTIPDYRHVNGPSPRTSPLTVMSSGSGVMQWLQDHSTAVYASAGVLVGMAWLGGLAGRGRR